MNDKTIDQALSYMVPNAQYLLSDEVKITKQQLKSLFTEAMSEVIGLAPSCEPDCTPERHAYHQGAWDYMIEQEEHQAQVIDRLFNSKEEQS